jgi:putative dimethyl sulfoxide reductase chaperone
MMETDSYPLSDFYHSRKSLYQLLQLLFFQPISNETVTALKKDENLQGFKAMNEAGEYLYDFFSKVTEDMLQVEKNEFNRLFTGPGMILAPPWESVYRSKEHLLFDETTFQVRELYHQFGLQYCNENYEPDDHLAIELEFILYLNDLCLKETESERMVMLVDQQILFLTQHMNQWVPAFCEKIVKNTDSLLYKGAALLLKDFIEYDCKSLCELEERLVNV